MSITAKDGRVIWSMTPNRARKVARVLRNFTNAVTEAARLETAAALAEEPPRSIHSQ